MRIVLFCEQKYTISMVKPIHDEAIKDKNNKVLWYIHKKNISDFEFGDEVSWTNDIQEIYNFSPEAIFVPCNVVPYDLPGVKVNISHGYECGEKRYFRIRDYFDLYLTQGPYFTENYQKLADKHKDFEVIETGWSRRDGILKSLNAYDDYKQELLTTYGKSKMVLYAPTFPPSLTSLPYMQDALQTLVKERNEVLLLFKFHPLTPHELKEEYKAIAGKNDSILWMSDGDINKFLIMSDMMISDSSSVVNEFLLLDKPVITIKNKSDNKFWYNIENPDELVEAYDMVLSSDEYKSKRKWIIDNFDPYFDGNSSARMLKAVEDYIKKHGVPLKRKMGFFRKRKSLKGFK